MKSRSNEIRTKFLRYLTAAFGSAFTLSIYSIFDAAIVGKYVGTQGVAALAVIAPIWNLIYGLGLMMGIGGSILFSIERGKREDKSGNDFFTTTVIFTLILSVVCWIILGLFDGAVLTFLGADECLLPLAKSYFLPIKIVLPVFMFNQMLAAFLRNDGNPILATTGVLVGGIFNMVGDYCLVFIFNMGIFGAGLATAMGACLSLLVMCSHFFGRKNTLRIEAVGHLDRYFRSISVSGFPAFFSDISMGILTFLFNRQVLRYLDLNSLAVYDTIINISTFVQCCGYSVGQAAQPLLSENYGAGNRNAIRKLLKYALISSFVFGVFWFLISEIAPNMYIYLFMKPENTILNIAPDIIRKYSFSYLLLPVNIFAGYYFQSVNKAKTAFIISVQRGLIVSGICILIFPVLFGSSMLWMAMPVAELITVIYVARKLWIDHRSCLGAVKG